MRTMRKEPLKVLIGFAIVMMAGGLFAQVVTPLHICCDIPVFDEYGQRLEGTQNAPGDLVQVLWATNGIIYPPDVDGTPHPANAMVYAGQTGIGALTSPTATDPAIFGLSIREQRLASGGQIFVRVFNATDPANATFYADSQLLTVDGNTILEASFNSTTNALDPRDPDFDGLVNSWEENYASDPYLSDSDGDGQIDGHEHRAGTDLLDAESLLQVATFIRIIGRDVEVGWESVTGKTYQVEFTADELSQEPVFGDVGPVVTAYTEASSATITNGLELGMGHFRVRLVE